MEDMFYIYAIKFQMINLTPPENELSVPFSLILCPRLAFVVVLNKAW